MEMLEVQNYIMNVYSSWLCNTSQVLQVEVQVCLTRYYVYLHCKYKCLINKKACTQVRLFSQLKAL